MASNPNSSYNFHRCPLDNLLIGMHKRGEALPRPDIRAISSFEPSYGWFNVLIGDVAFQDTTPTLPIPQDPEKMLNFKNFGKLLELNVDRHLYPRLL